MLVIAAACAYEFVRRYPEARRPLERWKAIIEAGTFGDIVALRKVMPTADAVKGTPLTCFNLAGNKYRLLAIISYPRQEVMIREMLTHAQYTKKYVR